MRPRAVGVALALVVLVNAAVLAGVAWNRSGAPEATLTLTERELALGYGGLRARENSGVALRLGIAPASRTPEWLDEAKLRELGFDPEPPTGAAGTGRRPLPRRVWVVLELDGPAWAAMIAKEQEALDALPARIAAGERTRQHLENAQRRLAQRRESASRLVPVDAGGDPERLRARYPDPGRYLITAAEVRVHYGLHPASDGRHGERRVQGHIGRLLPGTLHVPAQFHRTLAAATARSGGPRSAPGTHPPRYRATVHYGARHEPWIAQLQPMP